MRERERGVRKCEVGKRRISKRKRGEEGKRGKVGGKDVELEKEGN